EVQKEICGMRKIGVAREAGGAVGAGLCAGPSCGARTGGLTCRGPESLAVGMAQKVWQQRVGGIRQEVVVHPPNWVGAPPMPRAVPESVRQDIWLRHLQGQTTAAIALALSLAARTVFRLLASFVLGGGPSNAAYH